MRERYVDQMIAYSCYNALGVPTLTSSHLFQGAPSGVDGGRNGRYPANGAVRPKALWPVIGLRHPGDRVTMSGKWISSHGADVAAVVRNVLKVDEVLCAYEEPQLSITPNRDDTDESGFSLPQWFVEESFHECRYSLINQQCVALHNI